MTNIKELTRKLEVELKTITSELEGLGIHNPQVSKDWIPTPTDTNIHEPDQNITADRSEDLAERTATLAVLETRYNNLNRALQKISEGNYGRCEICDAEIETDRLEANPAARTCQTHLNDEVSLTD